MGRQCWPGAPACTAESPPLHRGDRLACEVYFASCLKEFDTGEHQLRGNVPQAFVHVSHLETATRLARNPDS
jgi:hypothetical protein